MSLGTQTSFSSFFSVFTVFTVLTMWTRVKKNENSYLRKEKLSHNDLSIFNTFFFVNCTFPVMSIVNPCQHSLIILFTRTFMRRRWMYWWLSKKKGSTHTQQHWEGEKILIFCFSLLRLLSYVIPTQLHIRRKKKQSWRRNFPTFFFLVIFEFFFIFTQIHKLTQFSQLILPFDKTPARIWKAVQELSLEKLDKELNFYM